jgi:phosphoribosylanthranilate isomerase
LNNVRVKICGLRKEEDILVCVEAGADYLGFVVDVPSSPRNLSVDVAQILMRKVPDHAGKVVVTVQPHGQTEKRLSFILRKLAPDAIQLHGHALHGSPMIRQDFPEVKFIKALPIQDESSVAEGVASSMSFDGVHADSYGNGQDGGTGRTHNWSLSARLRNLIEPVPLTLAGGLSEHNVAEAIRIVRPFAVDVSSGVESSLGVKDGRKIIQFVRIAKEAKLP